MTTTAQLTVDFALCRVKAAVRKLEDESLPEEAAVLFEQANQVCALDLASAEPIFQSGCSCVCVC